MQNECQENRGVYMRAASLENRPFARAYGVRAAEHTRFEAGRGFRDPDHPRDPEGDGPQRVEGTHAATRRPDMFDRSGPPADRRLHRFPKHPGFFP